mgnify:CR=1 FL=1
MTQKIWNLTPHNIDICNEEHEHVGTMKPSGLVVRAEMNEEVVSTISKTKKVPVWAVEVTKPIVINNSLTMKIGKSPEIDIVVSRIAADAILRDDEEFNTMWHWVWDGVATINILTVHKSQINRETGERYGVLGFAQQGQISRVVDPSAYEAWVHPDEEE